MVSDIYRQDECLLMGSPLLPAISNMHMEYMEEIALESTPPPWMKYINDTFIHQPNKEDVQQLLDKVNSLRPLTQFTMKKKQTQLITSIPGCTNILNRAWVQHINITQANIQRTIPLLRYPPPIQCKKQNVRFVYRQANIICPQVMAAQTYMNKKWSLFVIYNVTPIVGR